jgi:hypothetical protein
LWDKLSSPSVSRAGWKPTPQNRRIYFLEVPYTERSHISIIDLRICAIAISCSAPSFRG